MEQNMNLEQAFDKQIKAIALNLAGMILLTALTIVFILFNINIAVYLYSNTIVYLIFPIVQLLIVIFLSGSRVYTLSNVTAKVLAGAFAVITGITLFPLVISNLYAALLAFATTAIIFAAMAIYGYTTKRPLYKLRTYLLFMLIGLIALSVLSIFIQSTLSEFVISLLGVLLFTVYIAYDVNKIKMETMTLLYNQDYEVQEHVMNNIATISALSLYLDVVNLFIYLMRLFSKRK